MADGSVKCGGCGLDLDQISNAPGQVPCPACGWILRPISGSVSKWRMTNFALDRFVAQELSQLTECNALDLSAKFNHAEQWITRFITISMQTPNLDQNKRQYGFLIIKRASMALEEYNLGRAALLDYTQGEPEKVTLYFRALSHFEIAASLLYQTYDIVRNVWVDRPFESNDGSPLDRLNKIYNASKHRGPSEIPNKHLHAVWITNDGLADKEVTLLWTELAEIFADVAYHAQELVQLPVQPESGDSSGSDDLPPSD
jgi:hypothetical protein